MPRRTSASRRRPTERPSNGRPSADQVEHLDLQQTAFQLVREWPTRDVDFSTTSVGRTCGGTMSNELEKARQQIDAGQYKKAESTLWGVECRARDDLLEARGLLEAASTVRDHAHGRVRDDASELIRLAQQHIKRAEESRGRVELGVATYLGGCCH